MLHLKNYRNNNGNIVLKCRLKYLQTCLNASIEAAKEKYYQNTVNKLNEYPEKFKSILVSNKSFLK